MPDPTDLADAAVVLRAMAEQGIRIDDRKFERYVLALLAEYDRRGAEIERMDTLAQQAIKAEADAVRELEAELVAVRSQADRDRTRIASLEERNTRLGIVAADAERRQEAQRNAVLALHPREESVGYGDEHATCGSCREADEEPTRWPCPTAKALGVTE